MTKKDIKEKDKQLRKEINEIFAEIINYKKGMVFPTVWTKKIKHLREGYSYETIKHTILELKDVMRKAVEQKNFPTNYSKVAYLVAIITNKINDIAELEKQVQINEEVKKQANKKLINEKTMDIDYQIKQKTNNDNVDFEELFK